MTIRRAEPGDLDPLVSMMERFAGETDLPVTFDFQLARETLWGLLHTDDAIFLVDDQEGILSGMVLGFVEADFLVEKCAYVVKFYVEKEFRGLGVAHDLVKAFDDAARKQGAALSFASGTAGMGEITEKLYVRLFEKHDYSILGRTVFKDMRDG